METTTAPVGIDTDAAHTCPDIGWCTCLTACETCSVVICAYLGCTVHAPRAHRCAIVEVMRLSGVPALPINPQAAVDKLDVEERKAARMGRNYPPYTLPDNIKYHAASRSFSLTDGLETMYIAFMQESDFDGSWTYFRNVAAAWEQAPALLAGCRQLIAGCAECGRWTPEQPNAVYRPTHLRTACKQHAAVRAALLRAVWGAAIPPANEFWNDPANKDIKVIEDA